MEINQIVNDFNSTLLDLVQNISDVCPDTIIADNKTIIKNTLLKGKNKRKAIDTFVAKVLIYKPQIDSGNEDFFLNKSYDSDLKGVDTGNNISGKIFEFKSIWKNLKRENKDFVIQYMQILCLLAQRICIY
jgi:hypothetical protein